MLKSGGRWDKVSFETKLQLKAPVQFTLTLSRSKPFYPHVVPTDIRIGHNKLSQSMPINCTGVTNLEMVPNNHALSHNDQTVISGWPHLCG